jgi:hypothetical protein
VQAGLGGDNVARARQCMARSEHLGACARYFRRVRLLLSCRSIKTDGAEVMKPCRRLKILKLGRCDAQLLPDLYRETGNPFHMAWAR